MTLLEGRSLSSLPLRSCFQELQQKYLWVWLALDCLCDLLYLLDIVVHFHTGRLFLPLWRSNLLASSASQGHFLPIQKQGMLYAKGLPLNQTHVLFSIGEIG